MRKKIIYGALAVLLVAQFIRPPKNKTLNGEQHWDEIQTQLHIPNDVHFIFRKACYDCHSNHTKYPWYNSITPVNWLLYKDIRGGKYQFNFSTLNELDDEKFNHELSELIEEVEEGKMPMKIYTVTHKDAILTKEEIKQMTEWARSKKR